MSISRRNALASGAAAIVTGATVAPLAIKATATKAALGGDPVLPAFEAYEAARLEAIAASDYRLAIVKAVHAELPPEPHRNRFWPEMSEADRDKAREWNRLSSRRITARLGMDEDDFMDIYYDRTMAAYEVLSRIMLSSPRPLRNADKQDGPAPGPISRSPRAGPLYCLPHELHDWPRSGGAFLGNTACFGPMMQFVSS